MSRAWREPIPAQPFLDWCEKREGEIARNLSSDVAGPIDPATFNPVSRLLQEIGWEGDAGARRLYRWRHDNLSGLVERAHVEDALDHAEVGFWDVYPDLPEQRRGWPRHKPSNMTPEQLRAAHTVYMQGSLTMAGVAGLIWERYGFANQESARCALRRGWRILGLPVRRRCCAINANGARCEKAPLGGEGHCAKHDKRITRGWEPPRELIDHARTLHEQGVAFRRIGLRLVSETPWAHPTYAAKRFAAIAHTEGWHRQFTGGRPPLKANVVAEDERAAA